MDEPAKPKMGRPPIEIDWEQFDKLCGICATLSEIAGWFNCSEDTIENKVKQFHGMGFAEYHRIKSAGGRISLRRKQWQAALAGNITMMIWLGKQHLDQSDKQELSGRVDKPFQLKYSLEELEKLPEPSE